METTPVRIIEPTTAAQLDSARVLFRAYASSLGWDGENDWMASEIDALPGPYSPPRGSLMLACVGDQPAGVLGLQPVPEACRIPGTDADRAGELKRLFVHPRFRGLGVGRALIEHAESEARSRGYDSLVLTTSAEMMPLAQRLYESLGYAETAPYRDDMPYPHIRWMRKPLGTGA